MPDGGRLPESFSFNVGPVPPVTVEVLDRAVRSAAGQIGLVLFIEGFAEIVAEHLRPLYPDLVARANAEIARGASPSAVDALLRPLSEDIAAATAAVRSRPTQAEIDACLDSGGHYWNNPPAGANFMCTECGHYGALNVPAVNECGMAD